MIYSGSGFSSDFLECQIQIQEKVLDPTPIIFKMLEILRKCLIFNLYLIKKTNLPTDTVPINLKEHFTVFSHFSVPTIKAKKIKF